MFGQWCCPVQQQASPAVRGCLMWHVGKLLPSDTLQLRSRSDATPAAAAEMYIIQGI